MTSTIPYAEVIGDPITYSKSPVIHSFWLEALGIEGSYRATRVQRADLPDYFASHRADPAWRGCNVTMPLKLDALGLADEASDRAITAGAANIIIPRDGRLLAGNSDVAGAATLLAPIVAAGVKNGITLLGTGGAARAILVALSLLGLRQVRIQARDMAEAVRLAVEFRLKEEPRMFDTPIDTSGLINATPLGMAGHPDFTIAIASMPSGGWVFDLVTDPVPTPLLRAAAAQGLSTVSGLQMLVEQAADSFLLFFGKEAPRDRDEELMGMLKR